MNETQRMIFAAAHAGDNMATLNYNLCGLFLIAMGIIIFLLSGTHVIQFILDFLYTLLSSKDKHD